VVKFVILERVVHAWQFAKAQYLAKMKGWTPFVSMQDLYNLLYREEEREMIPVCRDFGVGLIPWSPLARGVLSGKSRGETLRSNTDDYIGMFFNKEHQIAIDANIVSRTKEVAEKHKTTPAQVAIAWLLSKSIVSSPIVGTSNIEQLEELVHAVTLKLNPEDLTYLEELYHPRPVLGYT